MTTPLQGPPVGGGFLLEPCGARAGFVPEDLSEETREFIEAAREFMSGEVMPRSNEIDKLPEGLMAELLRKSGELGFLSIDVPEAYDGLGLDKKTSTALDEIWAWQSSFSVSRGGHVGIGTLPITYFGTAAQKERYLPKLSTGEWLAAYALSEPGSGSDALGALAKAELSDDGAHWILNGTKQFITNAGFAEVFTVFAKVDGTLFTAFLMEKDDPGLSTGAEESKMGQKGSSTRQLILEDARIPKDRLLGEVGQGHKVAFNILNIGRFKLGACVLGSAKYVLDKTIEYCSDRKQFSTPIIEFGALRGKVAAMVARCYACEAMAYRLADYFDEQLDALDGGDPDYNAKALKIIEEYAVETSIMKVFGTETYRLFVDECFQMLGGYGYLTEYHTERPYRDERVNRIYEGTNEINRLLIPGTLMKRQARGRLNLLPWIEGIQASLADGSGKPDFAAAAADGTLGAQALAADQLKSAFGLLAGAAAQRYGGGFEREQEVMIALADIAADAYTADSAVHRARTAVASGRPGAAFHEACATYWVAQAWDHSGAKARRLAYTIDAGDGRLVGAIELLTPPLPGDLIAAGRTIADHVVEAGGYRPY